jgi:hypothetical protein
MGRSRSLAAALLSTAAALQPAWGQTDITPRFTSLPERVVGVLVSHVDDELRREGRVGPNDALGFARGSSSYRWVYVPCEDGAETAVVLTGVKGEGRRKFDAVCLLTASVAAEYKVPEDCALVELEVNGGLGCPKVDTFVATELRAVDGTDAYPIQAGAAVADARERFERHCQERGPEVEREIERLTAQALAGRKGSGKRESTDLAYITWLPKSERLRVDLRRQLTDGAFAYATGAKGQQDQANASGGLRYGTLIGVELRMVSLFSKSGKLESAKGMPISGFNKTLPPPK